MRSAVLLVTLFLSAPALAEFDAQNPPPDWMVRGYEAAISDPAAVAITVEEHYPFADLAKFVPASNAGDFVDKLLPLLGNQDSNARSAAAGALGQITPVDRTGIVATKLLPLLSDPDGYVRSAAAGALGQITPVDRAGIVADKLLPLLGDHDGYVRYAAAEALGRITAGDRAAVVAGKLLPLLGDQDVLCAGRGCANRL